MTPEYRNLMSIGVGRVNKKKMVSVLMLMD
jgi:hypothetical protein